MKVEVLEKGIARSWVTHHSKEDKIQLSELMKPKDMVVAYAFSQIESPKAQKAILSLGSNDGIRVFLNGKEVHEESRKEVLLV